ncbi:MAG: SIMPL domain-containing protein [Clostridiales bacterium]|nr:SIMPL domain-containing protein [Clostridiales bacterium]
MVYSTNNNNSRGNRMILNGNGQVTAIPDLAVLRIGVQTSGDNLANAQQENARLSQSFLEAIQQLGVTDIRTFQYTIDRIYDFENGTRIDRGYSVRNIFEIRMHDLDMVGTVIDTAVSNGANVVEFINFEVSNLDMFYQQALNMAVRNAIQKAKSISLSLGTNINPIPVKITENSLTPIPFSDVLSSRGEMFTTPVEPGDRQINASVTAEFIY